MKRTAVAAAVFLLLLSFPFLLHGVESRGIAVSDGNSAGADPWGQFHALIIGIDAYQEWNPLQTAVEDATALRDILVERYGFKKKNVVLLVDGEASRSRITMALRNLVAGLDQTDNLLIYYAGHGQIDDLSGDGYWIPAEGKLKDPSTWVAHSMVKNLLSSDSVRAKNIILVADACYSGTLLREGPSMLSIEQGDYVKKLRAAAARASRQVITSGGMEPVTDGGRDGHSLFAYYLLKALKENDREVIDLENLFHTRVWGPVTQVGDQRPNVGRLKTPMDEDGQFVLTNLARSRQIAALKAAEAEQADRQRGQLAALMAEKERLEAERRQLELEKQILEERKKLEVERRRIEEEKRRLEMERLAVAEKRTDRPAPAPAARPQAGPNPPALEAAQTEPGGRPMQTAYLSPPASRPRKGLPLKIALMPWEINPPVYAAGAISEHATFDTVLKTVAKNKRFSVSHSYFDFEPPSGTADRPISPLNLSEQERDALWQREGLFSRKKASIESAQQLAKNFGFDLGLFISLYSDGMKEHLFLTLVDAGSGQAIVAEEVIRYHHYEQSVRQLLENQLREVLQQRGS